MMKLFLGAIATAGLWLAVTAAAPAQDEAPAAAPNQPAAEAQNEGSPKRIQLDLKAILGQARAAVAAGNIEEAVKLYQIILRFMPDNRVVRIELSFALTALGERDRAARLLRDVDREGLDPDVIATIDRIIGPGRLNFFVIPSIIIDDNINGQTKKDRILVEGVCCLDLGEDAKGREAYGYGMTLGVAYRLRKAAPRTTVTAGVRWRDLNGRQDDTANLFGSLSLAFDPGPRTTLVPSLSGTYRTKVGDPYEWEYAGGAAFGFDVGPVRTTLTGRYTVVDGLGDFKELRDRTRTETGVSLGYGLSRLGLRFDGRLFREDWTKDTQDNEGFKAGMDLIFVGAPWLTPTIGGSATRTDFENPDLLFKLRRMDRDYEGHIEFAFGDLDIFGFDPVIRYTFRHNTSNIGLFDFNEHEVTLGFKAITF